MTKKAKGVSQWSADLLKFSKSGKTTVGIGQTPAPNTTWSTEYTKIQSCPKQLSRSGTQSTLSFASSSTNKSTECSCGWHDGSNPLIQLIVSIHTRGGTSNYSRMSSSSSITNTSSTNDSSPSVEVPFLIPGIPKARTTLDDVKNKCMIYPGKKGKEFDLLVFGLTNGNCPHCSIGRPKPKIRLNSSVKIIHTLNVPRFVQGVGMNCNKCDQPFQSYEKGYVSTLPKHQQSTLNAIICGKSNGIDMGLVTLCRSGMSAQAIEKTCAANLHRWHHEVKDNYTSRLRSQIADSVNVRERVFPSTNESWAATLDKIMRAFIRDYLEHRDSLNREMASHKSEVALSLDHQAKVVKHAKGGDATQSCTIVGDGGLVLAYCCVPTDDMAWADIVMREIVERHGAKLDPNNRHRVIEQGDLPRLIYVDKDCCNGKEGGRTDSNKYFYGMLKMLDAFHLILRIGREINSEHDRKARFMSQLSFCIFTTAEEDARALREAREVGGLNDLSSKQKKYDKKFVRRIIRDADTIVTKILLLVKANIALDREARLQFEMSGKSCENLSPAHDAYPLMTRKVSQCVFRQLVHVLNGCITDLQQMNVSTGSSEYRDTGISLPTYRSLRGTSKVEAVHSVADRATYTFNNIRQIVFDARVHWKLTNYNRGRLRDMDKDALPDSIAPSEVDCTNIVPTTSLKFGFDYCHHTLLATDDKIRAAVKDALDSDVFDMAIDDYNIDSPDSVHEVSLAATDDTDIGKESIPGLGSAIPSTDIPNVVNMSNIDQVIAGLESDLDLTLESLSNNAQQGIDLKLEATNASSTLADCLNTSNKMAAENGIDLETTGAGELTRQAAVSKKRNVAKRRKQNQQTPNVTPAFNKIMLEKWTSIWSDPSNPQPQRGSTTYYKWYCCTCLIYEKWRITELSAAKMSGSTPPPLYQVAYKEARNWAIEMKALSNSAHAAGVVNEATAAICHNLDTVVKAVDDDNHAMFDSGGVGAAMGINTLATQVSAASGGSPSAFASPTAERVRTVMKRGRDGTDNEIAALLKKGGTQRPKKKAKVDTELQQRIKTAAETTKKLKIAPRITDNTKKRKVCPVCDQYWDFNLNIIPHRIMVANVQGEKQFRFCPLGDDHKLLRDYLKEQQGREAARLKEKYENTKKSNKSIE